MLPLILIAGALAGLLVAAFWKELARWIVLAAERIKERIGHVVVGATIFLKKMRECVQEISKHYSQNENGRWSETIVTREISEIDVPEKIKKLSAFNKSEVIDITEEMELQLR